jgi:hypothetical protein
MALKTPLHPLKHPLKALNPLKERRKKLKKSRTQMRALRMLRALRGKIRGVGGVINQSKKLSRVRSRVRMEKGKVEILPPPSMEKRNRLKQ